MQKKLYLEWTSVGWCHRYLTPFRAEWDPKDPSERTVVVGRYISEDFGGQPLHPVDLMDAATGRLLAELVDPNLTHICPGAKLQRHTYRSCPHVLCIRCGPTPFALKSRQSCWPHNSGRKRQNDSHVWVGAYRSQLDPHLIRCTAIAVHLPFTSTQCFTFTTCPPPSPNPFRSHRAGSFKT